MRLHELLTETANVYGDRPAVTHGDRSISYERLRAHSGRLAAFLREQELPSGGRVGVLVENTIEYVISFFAVLEAGLVMVPLDTSLQPDKLRFILEDSGAAALITQTRYARHLPAITAAPSLLKLVVTDKALFNLPLEVKTASLADILDDIDDNPKSPGSSEPGADAAFFARLMERAAGAPHELAAIFYTSGSTGSPKGVMLSHRNLISNTVGTIEYLRLNADESVLVILPFYYIYGNSLLLTHVAVGGRVVIDNRFTYPEVVIDTMERERVTGFSGVPSNFMILLDNSTFARRELPHLRYFTQAGGAMAPEVIRRLTAVFPQKETYIMYGQTEASPRVTWLPPERLDEKLGSIGVAVPGVIVRVVDAVGNDVPPGVEGEIVVGGDSVMMGYWNQPDEQAEVLRDGWLYTGDLARIDDDGFLFIVGRKKEIIKSGGNRVSAKEVEETVLEISGVSEVAVYGVPDPILGEAIRAVVVLRADVRIDEKAIRDFCKGRLAVHKVPKTVQFMDSLPKYQSGKVNKQALRNLLA